LFFIVNWQKPDPHWQDSNLQPTGYTYP